jgi:heme/copper-type cytochrome/quinol oxidase subunit 2
MTLALVVLLHGDDMDLIYFWSSIFMILLPITIFTVLTYFVVRAYRKREQGAGSTEQKASN